MAKEKEQQEQQTMEEYLLSQLDTPVVLHLENLKDDLRNVRCKM